MQIYSIAGRVNEAWIDVPEGSKKYYGQLIRFAALITPIPIVIQALNEADYAEWLLNAKEEFASASASATLLASAN